MSDTKKRYEKWEISADLTSDFEKHFERHPEHTKLIPEFETDVTTNPFRHPVAERIRKIQSEGGRYPDDCYRWRKQRLRIVYFPEAETNTVYPLDADLDKDIKYKKRK